MVIRTLLKRNTYYDSISLMSLAQVVKEQGEVDEFGAVMATRANLELLQEAGLLPGETLSEQDAGPDDLLIAARAQDEARALEALALAERHLASRNRREAISGVGDISKPAARSLEVALRNTPTANLAVVSVAGEHAWLEAEQALRHGLHVFLFSNNVPVEQERRLKELAISKGLLLMGPDCGTAILNGVALGFSHAVTRGSIGIVGASGTGMQQLICLLDAAGLGISQAIGTGGRDLSEEIGGLMTRRGLKLLARDPATKVIALVAKSPAGRVARELLESAPLDKPVVAIFLNTPHEELQGIAENVVLAQTLSEGAEQAISLASGNAFDRTIFYESPQMRSRILGERAKLAPSQRYLRALFSGGTLCYEAMYVCLQRISSIYSNIPLRSAWELAPGERFHEHTALDLGTDEFTRGKPHPMIDPSLRLSYLEQAAADRQTAAVLMDIVLGFCAHPDPASVYAPVIARLREAVAAAGRSLPVIISLCGTDRDPQSFSRQRAAFEAAGAYVYRSNVEAALSASSIVDQL